MTISSNKEIHDTLMRAVKLITPRHQWTQGSFARFKGRPVPPDQVGYMDSWCADGAIKFCAMSPYAAMRARTQVEKFLPRWNKNIHIWNDTSYHKTVLLTMTKAAKLALVPGGKVY